MNSGNRSRFNVIGTVGVPACYGGFETLVENLLPSYAIDTVYCSSRAFDERSSHYKNANLKYLPINANGVQSVFYDIWAIVDTWLVTKNDLLILGVSGALVLPLLKLFSRRRVIINIDGIEWKRAKWNRLAKAFLKISESIGVRFSDVVIADNQAIGDYVRSEYGVEPVIIPYGGEHAVQGMTTAEPKGYALSICRIEPENNVHLILEAAMRADFELIFIGNWEGSNYGQALKSRYSEMPNFQLLDPIFDPDMLFEYRSGCSVYIHGHSAGGTNPSLVEAMHFGMPILAYDCVFNRETLENKGRYFDGADCLLSLLDSRIWSADGLAIREVAQRRYTWSIVKEQYHALFE